MKGKEEMQYMRSQVAKIWDGIEGKFTGVQYDTHLITWFPWTPTLEALPTLGVGWGNKAKCRSECTCDVSCHF
jgi:hypothetical protein